MTEDVRLPAEVSLGGGCVLVLTVYVADGDAVHVKLTHPQALRLGQELFDQVRASNLRDMAARRKAAGQPSVGGAKADAKATRKAPKEAPRRVARKKRLPKFRREGSK